MMRRAAILGVAGAAALAAAPAAVSAQADVTAGLQCATIEFTESFFNPNAVGVYPEVLDQLRPAVGVRFSALDRAPGDAATLGAPPGGTYASNYLPRRVLTFDASRPSGHPDSSGRDLDLDLGSPNRDCDEPCPAEYAGCDVCLAIAAADPGEIDEDAGLYLPADHSCRNPDGSYDYIKCPGIGCGGGRFLKDEVDQLSALDPTITYPQRLFNDTVVTRTQRIKKCQFRLDLNNCPQINPYHNCKINSRNEKLLIVQERVGAVYAQTEPDDNSGGGNIVLRWDSPVVLQSLTLLDMDEAGGVTPFAIRGFASVNPAINTAAEIANVVVGTGHGDNSRFVRSGLSSLGVIQRAVIWIEGSGSVDAITFCSAAGPSLEVEAERGCRYDWTVTETVNRNSWDLFCGESSEEVFTTTVTRSPECRPIDAVVTGTATARAPFAVPTKIVGFRGGLDHNADIAPALVEHPIQDGHVSCTPFLPSVACPLILVPSSASGPAALMMSDFDPSCLSLPGFTTSFLPNNQLTCTFDVSPGADLTPTNARVEFVAAPTETLPGLSFTVGAAASFPAPAVSGDSADVSVVDSASGATVATYTGATDSFAFNSTFSAQCAADDGCVSEHGPYPRTVTATVVPSAGASDSASASNQRTCWGLSVEKAGAITYDRTWSWTLDKRAAPVSAPSRTEISLVQGDAPFPVEYVFDVASSPADSNFKLAGTITVSNGHPSRAATPVVADVTYPGATVTCPSPSVPAGGSITCTFAQDLPSVNGQPCQNVASATQFGYNYTGSARLTKSRTLYDQCASLVDKFDGQDAFPVPGASSICGNDMGPHDETYSFIVPRLFTADSCAGHDQRVNYTAHNVATLTWASGSASDDWTVAVSTLCDRDCPPCTDSPMYPAALNGGTTYITPGGDGVDAVSLCWTD